KMLVLIDGLEGYYEDLVPEEIESISLLKDASATAMYGNRAANGVLLITTKRGESGKLKVSFSTRQGLQSAYRLPQFLGSYDYARLYNEALVNDGKPAFYSEADLEAYKKGDDPYFHPDVNWYDEVLRKYATITNYNLNFSGGDNTVKYFVLLNNVRNSNLYRRTGNESDFSINGIYNRVNFRSNVDLNITKRLSAALTIGGTVVDKTNPYDGNTDRIFRSMAIIPPNAFPVNNPNKSLGRNSLYTNPLGDILYSGFYTSNGRTLLTTLGFTHLLDFLTEGLSITGRISFNSWFLSQSNKSRTYESYAISKDINGNVVYTKYGLNTSLVGSEGASDQNRSMALQAFLNYDRTFGKNDVSGVLMYNSDNYTISGDNFPSKHINTSGRLTLVNNQKYIGEFSFACMGSEKYPKNSRFGFFPALSLGWVVSNEGFLKDNSVVNFLKIRGSYGLVGNELYGAPAPSFMFEQYYYYTSNYYFGTNNTAASAIIQGSPANRGVTWEKENVSNIGIEATIAKRVDVSLDVFNRDRFDILVQPNSIDPDFMGYIKPYLNLGKTNNRGLEGRVRFYNDELKNLRFFVELSAWYYKNKIVYSSEEMQLYDYLYRTGRPIGQPFGLVAIGFFKNEADIAASPKQVWTSVRPGDVKYKDQNNDNLIDQRDVYPIGKTNLPNFTGALHAGLKYKGFDFDMLFHGVSSRTVTFDGYYFHAFQNNGKISSIALNRWTPETAETATYPRLSSKNNENNYRYSTLWQRDGSFIKLRSIEIGFTLPASVKNVLKIDDARVFITGTNLFSLDHMEGYRDPEIAFGYPATRTYSLGINIQFR
ncbi:TPA: SusC/RagA family TonB-linked outer membrane protein, partial [bacterium]|nr:SusC/RagA family TonB-linked outer membrane protein [bacterium]